MGVETVKAKDLHAAAVAAIAAASVKPGIFCPGCRQTIAAKWTRAVVREHAAACEPLARLAFARVNS